MRAGGFSWGLRVRAAAALLLVAACGAVPRHGDPSVSAWNAVWPTPPDHAYWGTWKSGADEVWLQIESTGEGNLFRDKGAPAGWVKTPLRVVRQQWGAGWDFVTESGARYRLRGTGEDWIVVAGPGGERRFMRAALPEEVLAATAYRPPSAQDARPEFTTGESWVDSWWPF